MCFCIINILVGIKKKIKLYHQKISRNIFHRHFYLVFTVLQLKY